MKITKFAIIPMLFIVFQSCERPIDTGENPYSNIEDNTTETKDTNTYDPYSIFGLHKDIFLPTCANSGCHDGTFEPDFRTVESSYYSLVWQSPIKNDTNYSYQYRVDPGNSTKSMLLHRLTVDLNGNSGIMPLGLEQDSDYPEKKDEYINRIETWVNNGAPDFYGNKPQSANFPPVVNGVAVFQNGSMKNRIGIYEAVNVNLGSNVQMWFSFTDDKMDARSFTNATYNVSTRPDSFDLNSEKALILGSKQTLNGLFGAQVEYDWYADIDVSQAKELDVYYVRVTLNDGDETVQIPNEFSMFQIKKYFAIRFN